MGIGEHRFSASKGKYSIPGEIARLAGYARVLVGVSDSTFDSRVCYSASNP